jgi:nitrogen regulatory protein PII
MVIGKTIRADTLPKTKVEIVIDDKDAKEVTDSMHRHDRRRKNLHLHN